MAVRRDDTLHYSSVRQHTVHVDAEANTVYAQLSAVGLSDYLEAAGISRPTGCDLNADSAAGPHTSPALQLDALGQGLDQDGVALVP